MLGMMSGARMMKLDAATGAEFEDVAHHDDRAPHRRHRGGEEQSDGENPDAIALAKTIEADQTAEIAQMKDLLKS